MLSETASRVNGVLMLRAETPLRANTITRLLHLYPNATRVALSRLEKIGILKIEPRQGHTEYAPDRSSPYFRPALELALIDLRLRDLLPANAKILAIFAFGSVAAGRGRPDSDLDILIVGKVDQAVVNQAFRPVEQLIGRTIDVAIRTATETRQALDAGDSFIREATTGVRLWGSWE